MRMFKYLPILLFCTPGLCANDLFAQTNRIELLKTALRNAPGPSQQLDATLALCGQAHSLDADTLYHYARLAEKAAVALHDPLKEILAHTYLEIWLGRKSLFDSALSICNNDLKNITYAKAGDVYAKAMMQK